MIKQNYKHEHMFGICFVWVYIIKGFLPLNKGKTNFSLRGVCRPRRANFSLCLACKHRQALFGVYFYACGRYSHVYPKSLHKGKQNGLLRVLLSYNFLRQYAVISLIGSGRLEEADQLFKQARQRSKNVVWRQVYFVVQIFRYCTQKLNTSG